MIDEQEKKLIEQALSNLSQADTDHWCDSSECNIDTPCCSAMHNRAAARKLRAVIDPEMRSLHPNRLTHAPERIYFERWQNENERHSAVNGNHTALELILCPPELQPKDFASYGLVPRPSQRDADVATAIIQWLGTNCGHAFVLDCEARIEKERAERSEFYLLTDRYCTGHHGRDMFQRMLDHILKNTLPSPANGTKTWNCSDYGLSHLRAELNRIIQTTFVLFAYCSGKIGMEEAGSQLGMRLEEFRRLYEHAINAVADRVKRMRARQEREKKEKETAGATP